MKTSELINTVMVMAMFVVAAFTAVSCENKPAEKTNDPAKEATEENEIKFENKKLEKDAQFLVDATAFNREQIQLARLGTQKGNGDVKGLSAMMLTEHEKSLKQATDYAKNKQITVPDSISTDAADNYNALRDKNGIDFNKAFCERLVESHQKAIGFFEKESADSRDQDLKEWATTKLPDIRTHLDHIFAVQKKLGDR
ncbi:MAG: DUF4142 domain-containing protein [Bacteroidota bacterium]